MPPSGYSHTQGQAIGEFLGSCATSLEEEATAKGEAIAEALDREIRQIEAYKDTVVLTDVQQSVLTLTQNFYQRVRTSGDACRTGMSYRTTVGSVVDSIRREILSIQI